MFLTITAAIVAAVLILATLEQLAREHQQAQARKEFWAMVEKPMREAEAARKTQQDRDLKENERIRNEVETDRRLEAERREAYRKNHEAEAPEREARRVAQQAEEAERLARQEAQKVETEKHRLWVEERERINTQKWEADQAKRKRASR